MSHSFESGGLDFLVQLANNPLRMMQGILKDWITELVDSRIQHQHPTLTDHVTLTVGQVATILDLHVETVRGYIHLPVSDSKHLRSVKASTQYRIPPVWLAEWMERNEHVPDDANWLDGLAA